MKIVSDYYLNVLFVSIDSSRLRAKPTVLIAVVSICINSLSENVVLFKIELSY